MICNSVGSMIIVKSILLMYLFENVAHACKKTFEKVPRGKPDIANCVADAKSAVEQYFLIRNGFTLSLIWSETGDEEDIDPYDYYNIQVVADRWSDPSDYENGRSPNSFNIQKFMNSKRSILVTAYEGTVGLYRLRTTYTPCDIFKQKLSAVTKNCFFYIKPLPPIAVIRGGVHRVVPADEQLVFHADYSMDLDERYREINTPRSLRFNWSCTQTIGSFCSRSSVNDKAYFEVPKQHVLKGDFINATVEVTSTRFQRSSTFQVAEVRPMAIPLTIVCRKNCPPASDAPNIQSITFFLARCLSNCTETEENNLIWEIKPVKDDPGFKFDYDRDTQFGRNGPKFIINKNVLKAGTDYYISVRFKDSTVGQAKMIVKYAKIPLVTSCETQPSSGISLRTWFRLRCEEQPPIDKNNFYYLFINEALTEYVVDGYYPDVFRIKFLLPPSKGRKFVVKIVEGSGPAIFLNVNPDVRAASEGKTTAEILEIYQKFVNGSHGMSVSQLLLSKKPEFKEEGIKIFQALVNEVIANEPIDETYEFVKNITYSVVKDLLKSPPNDTLQLVTVSESVTRMLEYHDLAKSDPLLARFASKVCKYMIDAHADEIKRQKFPLNSEAQFNRVGTVLTKCMEANVRENFDIIRPVSFNITVLDLDAPSVDGVVVSEYYPNYIDFDEMYGKHLDNLNEITNTVIDSTAKAAKSLALATASGEHFAKTSGKYSATLVAKDEGEHLAVTKIQLLDVVLIPSHDFDNQEHKFDIIMSSWSKDIMWWNLKQTRVSTNILSVQFWHSSCKKRIKRFKSPVNLLMSMTASDTFNETLIESNVTIPEEYTLISGEKLNPYIRIHRIGIIALSVVHIKFERVSYLDVFDVVVTKFEFPSSSNFVVNETINTQDDSYYLRIINYEKYDIWGYLAILPSKRDLYHSRARVMKYKVTFLTSFCLRWERKDKVWKPSCRPGLATTLKVINCECLHFSVLAGYLQNAESLTQELSPIEILLDLDSCYIIFITLSITVAVYCILLILLAVRQKPPVYYLSDNSQDDLYAYLLIVRTENRRNAGTTSNVMVRLSGTKGSSEPHVLNYPDPKLRLLQKQGEDMFMLTTPEHLGKLQGIEIWYDCTGASPSWYCRDILVHDMQKDTQWYFRVKTDFSVTNGVAYLVSFPTEFSEQRNIFSRLKICTHFHTWELWAMEKNFSFTARLTVVFSNIVMVYTIVLALQGVPALDLRDSFDEYQSFYISKDALNIAVTAGSLSFLIHIIIAWIFRISSSMEFFICRRRVERVLDFSIFCWIVLGLLVAFSITSLVFFGFWVPFHSSLVWLISCIMAIFFDVVVLENLFILVQAFICNFRLSIFVEGGYNKIVKFVESERLELHTKFGTTLLRPYMSHLYRPLRAMQITKRRIVGNLRAGIYNDLEDLVMYGIYNIMLYVVILLNKGDLTTISKTEVISMMEGQHTRTLSFSKIKSLPQIYQYINETLIPTMQPVTWYANYSIPDAGLMIDNANKYIGIARLRQHRMAPVDCVIPELLKFLNTTCWPEFTMGNAEYRTFGYQWGKFHPSDEYDRMKDIYYYQTQKETETFLNWGRMASYPGGGYVSYLGRHFYNSYANFLKLWRGFWVDHKTRAFFIEFLMYNANYNVFVVVSLLYEYSATGYAAKTIQVDVIRMLFVQNEMEHATMVFFILFSVWLTLLILKLFFDILKNLATFYKKVWVMIDFLIIFVSVITISTFILRMRSVGEYLEKLEEVKHNEFVSYFNLLYAEGFLTLFSGILVGVATIRLWKFLRFGIFFRVMERTLSIAAFPLLSVTFAFAIILTGFGFSGILILGNEYPELSSFIKIVATLIQMALKPDQFDLSDYLDFQISYCYFSFYLVCMQVILLLYITVIIMAYVKAQLELSVLPDSYTVGDYIRERMEYLPVLIKTKLHRLRAGEKEDHIVTPKADEFRYANCVGIAKKQIQSMRFIVSCVVRNMSQSAQEQDELTEYEAELMLGVCQSFVLGNQEQDEYELFFKGHFEKERVRLIDEKRITKVADFVKLMFKQKSDEPTTSRSDVTLIRCVRLIHQKNNMLRKWSLQLKLMSFTFDSIDRLLRNLN